MALPTNTDLVTLDYAYLGAPFVQVEAKSLNTVSLDTAYLGAPFVAVGPAVVVTGFSVYVRVSGAWKQASAIYTNVNGVWKTVTTVSTRVSSVWKT